MLHGYQRRWAACTTEPRFGEVRLAFLIRKSTNRDDIMPPCIFGIETHIASLFLANDTFICTMVRLMMSFRKQYHSSRIREESKTSSFTPRLMSNHTSVRATVSSARGFHRDASPHRPTVLWKAAACPGDLWASESMRPIFDKGNKCCISGICKLFGQRLQALHVTRRDIS